jgi:hypothetical protein
MLASVPIMPRPSTCSNGGIWFIELNAFRLSKISHFKANKKALFLALFNIDNGLPLLVC